MACCIRLWAVAAAVLATVPPVQLPLLAAAAAASLGPLNVVRLTVYSDTPLHGVYRWLTRWGNLGQL